MVSPPNDCMMVQESHVLKGARLDHDPGVQEYRFGGKTGTEADQLCDRLERLWEVKFSRSVCVSAAIREGRLRDYVTAADGAEKVLHFGSKTTKEMHFRLSFHGGTDEYELKLAPTADD